MKKISQEKLHKINRKALGVVLPLLPIVALVSCVLKACLYDVFSLIFLLPSLIVSIILPIASRRKSKKEKLELQTKCEALLQLLNSSTKELLDDGKTCAIQKSDVNSLKMSIKNLHDDIVS